MEPLKAGGWEPLRVLLMGSVRAAVRARRWTLENGTEPDWAPKKGLQSLGLQSARWRVLQTARNARSAEQRAVLIFFCVLVVW
jgi:hypothetical protein